MKSNELAAVTIIIYYRHPYSYIHPPSIPLEPATRLLSHFLGYLPVSVVSEHPMSSAPCSTHIKRHGQSHNNAHRRQAKRLGISYSQRMRHHLGLTSSCQKLNANAISNSCHEAVPRCSFYLRRHRAPSKPRLRIMPFMQILVLNNQYPPP